MAAGNPRRAHPPAPQPAVPLDRLVRVVGAGRVVAAGGRQQLRERHLVTPNHGEQQPGHQFSFESLSAACSASARRSANAMSSAAGRAISTTSYRIPTPVSGESPPSKLRRASSRSRRRARFRSIDPLTARLTVTPTRLRSCWLGTAKATNVLPLKKRLPPIAAWKSPCPRRRLRRFTGVGRQPLAALAPAALHHACSAPVAHPAQETVHAFAIPLLGLEGSLDGVPL